jgi:hypothetical protein
MKILLATKIRAGVGVALHRHNLPLEELRTQFLQFLAIPLIVYRAGPEISQLKELLLGAEQISSASDRGHS